MLSHNLFVCEIFLRWSTLSEIVFAPPSIHARYLMLFKQDLLTLIESESCLAVPVGEYKRLAFVLHPFFLTSQVLVRKGVEKTHPVLIGVGTL